MSLHIVERINYGYANLEPVILGLMALNNSFMLIGRHGTGKTRLAKALSRGFGEKGFVFYDATKDDLISIAGIPDPEGIKNGKLRFLPHERSIWDKSTIVVDEITRAGRENQNLWLEILEERTCFGIPLNYRSLIATANPDSYAAAFQLDEALLDRFHAVLPVPEMQEGVTAQDVEAMVGFAALKSFSVEAEEIARTLTQIQTAHASLMKGDAYARVTRYLSQFVPAFLTILKTNNGPYVSPRTYSRNLPETLLAVAAYFEVAGTQEPLRAAAWEALKYSLATKLQIKPIMLEQIHRAAEAQLSMHGVPRSDQLRLEIARLSAFEERLDFLERHWGELGGILRPDELEKILGDLLRGATRKGDQDKLVILRSALGRLGYQGDAVRQVDGRLLITLNLAINFIMPKLQKILVHEHPMGQHLAAIENIKRFQAMITGGTFFSNATPEVLKLKVVLIDIYEGDQPADEARLVDLFSRASLL